MKNKVKILLENILKESVENQQDKPKIKLVPLWLDRRLDKEKQIQKMLKQEIIDGNLNLGGSLIENLGNVKHVKGHLDLRNCIRLKELPEGLTVEGYLDLEGCINLKELPKGLIVFTNLYIRGCKSLTSLPDDLQIGGELWLYGCKQQVIDQAREKYGRKIKDFRFF